MRSLRIVTPVFNDWASFEMLLGELNEVAPSLPVRVSVTAVDDGSTETLPEHLRSLPPLENLDAIEVVHLALNVGHQRAIAIGLCVAVEERDADAVLVMDADGEDSPKDIGNLVALAQGRRSFCVVAQRRRRSESLTFRLSYVIYKFIFKLLTAKTIAFGNFSLLSADYARRLVRVADLWNNLPAAILRSRLPILAVPTDRSRRYAGSSKMNFTSLVVHGLSGISVHAETIFVRLLMLTFASASIAALSALAVLVLRVFLPQHASPGWATTVIFGMVIILVQVLSITLSSILMLLNSRVQQLVIPIADYEAFVDSRQTLQASSLQASPQILAATAGFPERLA